MNWDPQRQLRRTSVMRYRITATENSTHVTGSFRAVVFTELSRGSGEYFSTEYSAVNARIEAARQRLRKLFG